LYCGKFWHFKGTVQRDLTYSDERGFFGKILMKLAWIAYNAKNGIPLFFNE
jgi:hypothetical protein